MLTTGFTAVVALLAAKASATIYYAGVAESSGEFGVWSKFYALPNSQIGSFGDWISC
jgi:endoglucanase